MSEVPDDIDFDAEVPVGDLKSVTDAAKKLQKLQFDLSELEGLVKEKKSEISDMESQTLPDLMDACSVKTLTLDTGEKLKMKSVIRASLPTKTAIEGQKDPELKEDLKHRLKLGLAWMRGNGGEGIIKNRVVVEFSKGQDNMVGDFIGKAEELSLPYKREESINAASLSKFISEKMAIGSEVPMDTLKVYCGRKATVK